MVQSRTLAGNNIYLKGNVGLGMAMDTDINNMPAAAGSAKMTFDNGFLGTLAALDLSTSALPFANNDNVLAYQLMAGVGYAISDQWSIDAQYRFLGTNDVTISGADFNSYSNDLLLGLRYSF